MNRYIFLAIAVALLSGCGLTGPSRDSDSLPPILLDEPAEFTVNQRSSTPLPGSGGGILLSLDDITQGQVLITIAGKEGRILLPLRSVRQNDVLAFEVDGHAYKLKLKRLENFLVGIDRATFLLWPMNFRMEHRVREDARIEGLIAALGRLEGCAFVRNGKEYPLKDGATYLELKWKQGDASVSRAEDFIERVASRSSRSGKPYLIRRPDGSEVTTGEWFGEQLRIQDEGRKASGSGRE